MRRFLILIIFLLVCIASIYAQNQTIIIQNNNQTNIVREKEYVYIPVYIPVKESTVKGIDIKKQEQGKHLLISNVNSFKIQCNYKVTFTIKRFESDYNYKFREKTFEGQIILFEYKNGEKYSLFLEPDLDSRYKESASDVKVEQCDCYKF